MNAHLRWTILLLPGLVAGCKSPTEADCQPGWGLCNGVCEALDSDRQNCGACGNECGSGQACANGACVADCAASLRAPIDDSRGALWDGLERPAATLANAKAACEAIGGRLPIVTEAYRVSAAVSGEVGQPYQVNPIWTLVKRSATTTYRVKLSDGTIEGDLPANRNAYRCICPPSEPSGFSGYACNGPSSSPCTALTGGNAGYSMDSTDRAPLTATGAMWECSFVKARLPSFLTYAEAIVDGLPNGSGSALHTADATRLDSNATVAWTGSVTSWAPEANTWSKTSATPLPFRCVGRTTAPATAAALPADAFVGTSGIAADAADQAAATWVLTHDGCATRGGHLPFAFELAALIQQGLGAGSNTLLFNADQEGLDTTVWRAGATKWTGAALDFEQGSANFTGWLDKAGPAQSYRCLFYPVDPAFAPSPTACFNGCQLVDLPGGRGAKLWLDGGDRGTSSLIAAINTCRSGGGHLATARDLTEAIRIASVSGSGAWLHTGDVAVGSGTTPRNMQVKWSNVDTSFTDLNPNYSQWSTGLGDGAPFRCVWTNEIR